jgi:hypothetical protein
VGVTKSLASFTLHVVALSPFDGDELSTKNVPSSIAEALTGFLTLSNPAAPQIVWLEEGSVKSITLTPILNVKVTTVKGATFGRIMDVGIAEQGHFVAVHTDGSATVFRSQTDRTGLKSVWEFEQSVRALCLSYSTYYSLLIQDDMVDPIYAAGLDEHNHVHASRVYWAPSIMVCCRMSPSSHHNILMSLSANQSGCLFWP